MSGRTDALLLFVQNEASAGRTGLDWCALHGGIALVADETLASHGSDWKSVKHGADGVDTARVGQLARVRALSTDAGSLYWAVVVGGAANLNLSARGSSIANVTRRTRAVDLMVGNLALSRVVAGVGDGTRILTHQIDTRLLRWTIGVVDAGNRRAGLVGISCQPRWARTSSLVTNTLADGVSTARQVIRSTNRSTIAQATGMGVFTVIVRCATHSYTLNFGIAVEARLADTDRPMIDHFAFGIESTGAGVLTKRVDASFRLSAIVVSLAAGHERGQGFAATLIICDISLRTHTDHSLDGQ